MRQQSLSSWLTATALCVTAARALSTDEWKSQSIFQVITDRFAKTDGSTDACSDLRSYCGGTWEGLINKLDYIQNMGFTAVWISPVVENLEEYTAYGNAYHGYWAQDIYALNPHFGTEADLTSLSTALHGRGMYLMVDVVTNHMGYDGCGTCVDYTVFNPFNTAADYHPFCLIDYDNATSIEECWEGDNTVSLPDLDTEDSGVRDTWNSWIADLVATYGIDGLRIDSAKHVEKDFWPGFEDAAGVYAIGEVLNGDPAVFPDWLNYLPGVMNYPVYYWVTRAFQSTSATMTELLNGINTMKGSMATNTLGSFLENHDNPRFASLTSDYALAQNAIAFTMLADGIPVVYQGQEQHFSGASDPNNREALWPSGYDTSATLYTWIARLNAVRNTVVYSDGDSYLDYQAVPTSPDSHTIALRKGSVVSVHTNIGASGSSYQVSLGASATGFTAGEALTEAMACTTATADSSGGLAFTMGSAAKVFVPTTLLAGSGICDGGDTSCATVSVTFNEVVTTSVGQTIKIVGNIPQLGNWAPASAIALSASQYTDANHVWRTTLALVPGTAVSYKYIRVAVDGTVTWEADPNRSLTVPSTSAACGSGVSVSDTWQA